MPDESARKGRKARTRARALTTPRRRRITVRAATPDDLVTLVAMRLSLLQEEENNPFFADPHPKVAYRAVELTRLEMDLTDQVFLLAMRGDDPVGMLRCRAVRRTPLVVDTRQAIVTTAYVIPSERRTGVMRALLDAADRWCRENQLSSMRLQCALTNDIGQLTWQSLGFEPAEVLYLRPVPRG